MKIAQHGVASFYKNGMIGDGIRNNRGYGKQEFPTNRLKGTGIFRTCRGSDRYNISNVNDTVFH